MSFTIFKAIRDRRSVRKYFSKEVPESVLQKVLDAARWAPSAHNAQPWRFILIRDLNVKRRLAEAMAGEWSKNMLKDGFPPRERERLVKASVKQFTSAPIIFVVCLTMEDMHKYHDEKRRAAEYVMAVQSVAAAIQNMLLAAHAEGLGACWFCAPLFCPKVVRETLEIPDSFHPQALITMGYPAESPKTPGRKSLESIVYQTYGGVVGDHSSRRRCWSRQIPSGPC